MLVHTDVTSNWYILAAKSYRISSVLGTGTLWLDLKKYMSFLLILWKLKCNIHSISERNILLNRIFHFSTIKGKAWSIYGGILGVHLKSFVLSTWDKMATLAKKIYKWNFSECTKLKSSLKQSITFVLTNPKLTLIFVIRFWPTAIHITATVTWFYSKFSLWTFRAFVMIRLYILRQTK